MWNSREGKFSIGKMKGHSLNFGQSVDAKQKRHYWGIPNKNYGFYTTEQLLEVERRYKAIKTQGNQIFRQRYQVKGEPRFIVDTANPSFVHCCTCHNNPKRYINNAQICSFCQEHRKQPTYKSLHKLKQQFNPEVEKTPEGRLKEFQEKSIQVQLKLPLIRRHNSKYPSNCSACKVKESEIQLAKRERRILTDSPQRVEADSLLYSFSTQKKNGGKQFKF